MPPVSPRTQALMQPPTTPEDANMAFEEGFSQMAQNVLTSKFPDLLEQVVTFKVLNSDMDSGSAIGVFILDRNGITVHIPVILATNQIKPLEVMYMQDKDIFLPLQRPWLEEIDRLSIDTMGQPVKPPKTLATDVNIRNLVVPPSTGRSGYASYEPGQKLAEFLTRAPNEVKKAFQSILENEQPILKFAFERLNLEKWASALHPHQEKAAEAVPNAHILTVNDTPDRFREIFGKDAGAAFQKAASQGFAIQDDRPYVKLAIETEEPLYTHEAKEPGFYRLYLIDGGTTEAIVVPNPIPLSGNRYDKHMGATPLKALGFSSSRSNQTYLVITADKQFVVTAKPPVGELLAEQDVDPKLLSLLKSKKSVGTGYGTFVRYEAGKLSATTPFRIDSVSTDSQNVRRIKKGTRYIVTDPKSAVRQVVAPKGSNVTYVPDTFKFIHGEYTDTDCFATSAEARMHAESMLSKAGSVRLDIANAGSSMLSIAGMEPVTKLGALQLMIHGLHLGEKDAISVLEKTAEHGKHSFYVVNPASLFQIKTAQGAMPPMPQQGAMPPMPQQGAMPPMPQQGAMPPMPQQDAMPPEAMGAQMMPAEPPPPDPVSIAVTEIGSQLAEQAADVAEQLAEHQRNLSNQLNILEAVQQRAQEVAGSQMEEPIMAPPGTGAEGPITSEALAGQATPMLGSAAELEDPEAFEATAIGSLSSNPDLRGLVADYIPTLETALDNLARILVSLWLEEDKFRSELGEKDYSMVEDKLRTVFNNLGSLVLKINQTIMATVPENEAEAQS